MKTLCMNFGDISVGTKEITARARPRARGQYLNDVLEFLTPTPLVCIWQLVPAIKFMLPPLLYPGLLGAYFRNGLIM